MSVWVWLCGSFLGYVGLALWFPLVPNAQRLLGLRQLTPSLALGLAYSGLICLLYAAYWLIYRQVRAGAWRPSLCVLLATAAILALPTLFTYPYNANDIYRYILRGRITSFYAADPFVVPPAAFPDDPMLSLAGEWATATSPYGPVWELTAAAVTALTGMHVLLGMLSFKALALAAHLATAVGIWHTLRTASEAVRTSRVLLWLLNPALLLIFGVDGHNDSLMLFWLVSGWAIWQTAPESDRPLFLWLGFGVMLLAPLTKPIGLLPLPFLYLYAVRRLPDTMARLRFAFTAVVGGLGLLWITFLPFSSPLDLAARLMAEAGGGASFSPATLLLLYLKRFHALPLTERLIGRTANYGLLLLALAAVGLALATLRGRSPLRAAADVFWVYLWQALNFRLWYTAWPFPFLLLDVGALDVGAKETARGRLRLHVGAWFLLIGQLTVFIYGHVWAFWLGRDFFSAYLIGVPFTFVLPSLLAGVSALAGQGHEPPPMNE